jgi:hypothetical protein
MNTFKFFLGLLAVVLCTHANASTPNISCELNQGQKYCKYLSQTDADWDTALPPGWTPILPSVVPILESLTDKKIQSLISKKRPQFQMLKEIEVANNLPEGTLRVKWLIESVAGELNIRNKFGYDGHFQVGDYEAKRYGIKDRRDLKDSAIGVVRLLRDYSDKSGIALTSVWNCYSLHQQGFNGAANIVSTANGGKLRKDVKRNMLNNIPKSVKREVFAVNGQLLLSDRDLARKFQVVWSKEVERILTIVLTS